MVHPVTDPQTAMIDVFLPGSDEVRAVTDTCLVLLVLMPAFLFGKKLLQHAVGNFPQTLFSIVMTLFSEVDKLNVGKVERRSG